MPISEQYTHFRETHTISRLLVSGAMARRFEQFMILTDQPGTEMLKQANHQLVLRTAADSIEILLASTARSVLTPSESLSSSGQ
jgi:hypothetical protein